MKMRTVFVFLPWIFALSTAFAQEVGTLILEHVNVVDPLEDSPSLDRTMVLRGGKIQGIHPGPSPEPGERMDLRGAWVLPGLIDAHVHLMNITTARRMLSLGITTGRSMFTWNHSDAGLCALHDRGDADIPTVLASGYPVVADPVRFKPDLSSVFLDHPDLGDLRSGARVGSDGARRIVRANADRHAKWIKVFANERAGILETDPGTRNLNDDELNAAVREAVQCGLLAAAHAYSDEGVSAAVNAGVRTVEHGSLITEPTLKLMHDRGVYFVPTLYGFTTGMKPDSPSEEKALRPRMEMLLKNGRRAVAIARRVGVPVVAGADSGYEDGEPSVIDEIIYLASMGFSNLEAIRSATSLSAECLKISSTKGALKPGLDADLAVYADNPVKDLAVLRNPILVMNGGRIFLSNMPDAKKH